MICCLFPSPVYGGRVECIYTPWGRLPGGFDCTLELSGNYEKIHETPVFPADGICEGCFCFINLVLSGEPGAPQGSRGSFGVRRNCTPPPPPPGASHVSFGTPGASLVFIIHTSDLRVPKGPSGPPGAFQEWRPSWLARGVECGRNHWSGCCDPGEFLNLVVEGEHFELVRDRTVRTGRGHS